MMTQGLMEQYRSIKREILVLNKELAAERATYDKVSASMWEHPYIQMEVPVIDMGTSEQTIERLTNRIKHLNKLKESIEQYIDSVKDSRMRQIIYYRILKGLTWQQTANRIGDDTTADGLRIAFSRLFKRKKIKRKKAK